MKTFKYIDKVTWEVIKITAKNRAESDKQYNEKYGVITKDISIIDDSDKDKKQYSSISFSDFEKGLSSKSSKYYV